VIWFSKSAREFFFIYLLSEFEMGFLGIGWQTKDQLKWETLIDNLIMGLFVPKN